MLSFFFQAEDGIRDLTVTGVQTCALPISGRGGEAVRRPPPGGAERPGGAAGGGGVLPPRRGGRQGRAVPQATGRGYRSEERRVGKECRCGWVRYECKKEIILLTGRVTQIT